MSQNIETVKTYLDGFRKKMRMSMAEVFVMRDGKIAERRAWVIVLNENDYR
jgi:ketosteroid isomerase-like protein